MAPELLFQRDEYVIVVLLFGLLMLAAEAGYRGGKIIAARQRVAGKPDELGTLQGAMIGLLALLLAFSLQMAVSRFEARRELMVKEANAIGTAGLRSRMLPDPDNKVATHLFQSYLAFRLAAFDKPWFSPDAQVARKMAIDLQSALWQLAMQVGKRNPNVVPSGMFITAIGDLIDTAGERDAAQINHVPESVLVLLFLVATLTMGLVGYGYGFAGQRDLRAITITITVIALVIFLIIDLDRPERGLIAVGNQNLLELRDNPGWLEPPDASSASPAAISSGR